MCKVSKVVIDKDDMRCVVNFVYDYLGKGLRLKLAMQFRILEHNKF